MALTELTANHQKHKQETKQQFLNKICSNIKFLNRGHCETSTSF